MPIRRFSLHVVVGMLVVGAVVVPGTLGSVAGAGIPESTAETQTVETPAGDTLEVGGQNTTIADQDDGDAIEYEFTGGSARRVAVEGYRSGYLGTIFDVRVGESIRIPVRVTNTGDTTASYELPLVLDGEEVDVKSGELGPGEETVVEPGVRFVSEDDESTDIPTVVSLEVADWKTTVRVFDRDAMVVTDVEASESVVDAGEEVRVTATIENSGSESSETVEIWNWNETIHTETVSLDAGESTTIETTHTLEEIPGGYFTVFGNLVTGSAARVEIDDPNFDINESIELNNSDWKINNSDFDDSDWETNDSDWETNDSGWEADDSDPDIEESDGNGAGFGPFAAITGIVLASVIVTRYYRRSS